MNDPNEFPAYNQPLEPNSAPGQNTPSAFAPYGQTLAPVGPPPVLAWYKVYAGFMAFLYFACIVGGIALLKYAPFIMANEPDTSLLQIKVQATLTAVVGIVLFIAYVVALLLPKSSGAWIYHAVMIAIGLTSCCLWPATIPLMIAWIKPETQSWFGRVQPGVLPPPRDPNVPPPPIPSA